MEAVSESLLIMKVMKQLLKIENSCVCINAENARKYEKDSLSYTPLCKSKILMKHELMSIPQ